MFFRHNDIKQLMTKVMCCGPAFMKRNSMIVIKQKRLCPACGNPVRENAVFCTSCGINLTHDIEASRSENNYEEEKHTEYISSTSEQSFSGASDLSSQSAQNVTDEILRKRRGEGEQRKKRLTHSVIIAACIAVPVFCVTLLLLIVFKPGIDNKWSGTQTQGSTLGNTEYGDAIRGQTEGTVSVSSADEHLSDHEATSDTASSSLRTNADEAQAPDKTDGSQESSPVQETPPSPPVFSEVDASSTLPPDKVTSYYGPYNAVDGDLRTAWNEGADGSGAGEWIRLIASDTQTINGVKIIAGYTKTEEIYYKNNRPRLITVSLSDGYSCQYNLEDSFGVEQRIDFGGAHRTTYVQVTIESVYAGTTWEDSSFTEIDPY
jgi:uncharacterized Zn finger protein (UPF0148 family)